MKFLPLLLANLFRRKVRTVLTTGSFVVALFLLGLLLAVRGAFNQGVEVAQADRLVVTNKTSMIQPLPYASRDRIARTPGIKTFTWANWFGGVYQDPKNFFAQFAIDTESWRSVYDEFLVPEDQWAAFAADRQGAIAGKAIADRFGWKVGDRIPIKGAGYPGDWEFNLRGIYTGRRPNDDLTQFWFQWKYLSEAGPDFVKAYIGWYVVRLEKGANAAEVARAIDSQFENSAFETRSQSESAFMQGFVTQFGNIELLILSIGGVVFFTLLLVTGNTMAMSVRERTGELAVLKTVGFGDGFVVGLVLVETLIVAALGGFLGLLAVKLWSLAGDPTGGMLPAFYIPTPGLVAGFAIALGVGLLAGLLPAWSAGRLKVVEALRRV
jgi:putative ABC transport system permease protein